MADAHEEEFDPHFDYRRLKETHETAGYREGLEAGEEVELQAGFDEGFAWGTSYGKEWAKLRGMLSALLSYVSSKDYQNKAEVINQLTQLMKGTQRLEEKLDVDNLILSPEHTPSKQLEQSAEDKNSNQDISTSTERNCCEQSSDGAYGSQDNNKATKDGRQSGTCCKEMDENLEKSCSSECQCGLVDKTEVENAKTACGTDVQQLLLECKSIVIQLGLNPDTIVPPFKHPILVLGQVVDETIGLPST